MELTAEDIDLVVASALAEDVGDGDLTTEGVVPAAIRCRAELVLEEAGVVCGVQAAVRVFQALDPAVEAEILAEDGTRVGGPDDARPARGPGARDPHR